MITLRPPAAVLPGRWSELLKEGLSDSFDNWLKRLYDPEATRPLTEPMQRYLDQAGLIERWAEVAGFDNVTVVVVDKANKDLLSNTFERLLGLPERTLANGAENGRSSNRSLTAFEADVLRNANLKLNENMVPWALYDDLIYRGTIPRLLDDRVVQPGEPKIRMPRWAAERATHDGKEFANRIAVSGVRVIGDLDRLFAPIPDDRTAEPGEYADAFRDIAIEALTGTVEGGVESEVRTAKQIRDADKARKAAEKRADVAEKTAQQLRKRTVHDQIKGLPPAQRVQMAVQSFSTRELVRALNVRLKYKVRTGKSKPMK